MNNDKIFEIVKELIVNKYWNTDLTNPFIIAGDTDSFFQEMLKYAMKVNGSEEDKLLACENLGKKFLDIINNQLLKEYLPNLLNWNKDQVHLLLEYEAIGRTYNLPVKKKYVFYMQSPKVELDIKGMETERSDYPSETRKRLVEIIQMLVVEKRPIQEIEEYIKETEKEFRKRLEEWDITLARPVSWTKPLEEYKKVPSHVIGMLIWNELTNSNDFRPGSKGYAFRIKVIKTKLNQNLYKKIMSIVQKYSKKEEIDWLVVPEDADLSFLKDIDGLFVDVESMINLVWLERIEILLEGISHLRTKEKDKNKLLWDIL